MADPTPTPQDSSIDPQVPGNFPGTVQNPTQVPAPVNPASDPEVPPLPNDVDPNFIPNPEPVNNTIDPEVPQPTAEFAGGKTFAPEPVAPATNPEVPQPTVEQNLFVDTPAPVNFFVDPEIPQPTNEQNLFVDQAIPQNFFVDPQVPEPPIVQNFFTDATPAPVENYFTDAVPAPIVQNFFTDATPVSPISNSQVPQVPADIIQNYFTDATPVQPAANPQVPNIFSSISALLSNLFGITPTPVAPAANPQVAQAIPVPTPVTLTPTPIPPAANPQVPEPPIVQNYFTDRTPAPVIPAANPQVPEPPIVQNYFVDEPPIVQNYFTDAAPAPIVQNYFTDAAPVSPAANPEVPQPPDNTALLAKLSRVLESPAGSATTVSPTADAQIPNPPTKIVAVSSETLLQNDPEIAQEYTAFKNETAAQLTTQRIAEREAVEGGAISISEQVQIAARAEIDATADANFRYQDQIEAAGAAVVVPADTPPPTPSPVAVTNNPQVVVPPTRIASVSTETLLQNDPVTAQEYTAFKTETAAQLTSQRIAEREAVEGGAISISEQVQIASRAEIDATADANFRYQDQIQAAGAGTVVPADTPLPTVAAPAVTDTNQPEVQKQNSSVVSSVSQSTLAQQDPATYRAYQTDLKLNEDFLTQKKTAEAAEIYGGEQNLTVDQLNEIRAEASIEARATVNNLYKNEIEAAGAGTVVASGTPPPTVIATPVDSAVNQQVPPPQTGEALVDPDNGEVLGYVDTATGEITDTPAPVNPAANPEVPSSANTTIASVNQSQLAQNDPNLYIDYNSAVVANTAATESQLTKQALDTYGVSSVSDLPIDVQLDIREQSLTNGVTEANTLFKDQLETSGAATTEPAGTPPPTVAPAPPSPSPYEIFLAQEAAATTAAEAEATARFNSQFDVVDDPQGPQIFPVEDPVNIEPTDLGTGNDAGFADFFGDGTVGGPVNDAPIDTSTGADAGFADFFGADAAADVGEFQAEPEIIADDNSGFFDFFGADAAADVGEFQAEPELGNAESSGFADFFGADAAADVGEFQAEPAAGDGESAGFGDFFGDVGAGAGGLLKSFAGAVSSAADPQASSAQQFALDSISGLVKSAIKTPNQLAAERQAAAVAAAKAQAQVNAQRKQANEGDWRVRLRLAGGADYLYKAKGANGQSAAGILQPLAVTDGVIFPYTPQITTQYQAKYNPYELTHSNYKGYFYQGSSVNEINITAQFTAQDTSEANYLLAVIHFFRSVTKMFYGQDDASKRGAPPPLVFLQGLGEYQFNLHPCVVSSFNYVLPADVDYIRANSVNFDGTNLLQRRDRQDLPIDYVNSVSSRLSNAGLTKGGLNTPPPPPTLGTKSPTYVPTKMEIQLVLLPVQTRSQVSQQFSLKQFASGDLIRGGFW